MSVVRSIRVGRPQEMTDANGRTWVSAFVKENVANRIFLDSENLDGDVQADLTVHGGPDKAVCVYSADNFPYWCGQLDIEEVPDGWFGENFTVEGADEWSVCIGDRFGIGDATVEITQPRGPCWKLGRRWGRRDMPVLLQKSHRTGWYLRVLQTGYVQAGDEMRLLDRPWPDWTVAVANRLRYHDLDDLDGASQLAAIPQLSERWRDTFRQRVDRGVEPQESRRLYRDHD